MHGSLVKNKKGYTLVELSIVLVIISFLVMGITSGKRLVESAKIYAAVSEINRNISAVAIFNTQYDAIPGDYDNSNSDGGFVGIEKGDGDGIVETDGSGDASNESVEAWRHLDVSEILIGALTGCSSGAACVPVTGLNIPASKLSATSYMLFTEKAESALYLTVGFADGVLQDLNNATSIPGRIAKGIDRKVDSVISPDTGLLTAYTSSSTPSAIKTLLSSDSVLADSYDDSYFYYFKVRVSI